MSDRAAMPDSDVAVIGGGLAGVAAAVTAAEAGARVRLFEAGPELGGNASGAFVHTLCGLFLPVAGDAAPEAANPGFPMRFLDALTAAGGAGAPEKAGRVWVVPTDPQQIGACARALCDATANVEVHAEAPVTHVSLSESATASSAVGCAGARFEARIVIDTSGTAVAARLGGADYEQSAADQAQLPSYIVRLHGVPAEDREGFGRLRLSTAVAKAAKRGALPHDCEAALLRPAPGSSDAYMTLNLSREAVAEHGDDLALHARANVECVLEHLRTERPGYATCGVRAWPRRVGRREGARGLGLERLELQDVLEGRRRPDEVALSSWPVELWQDHRKPTMRYPDGPCGVPLGALVSASHPNLGMAGRCMSASHEALGALRVLGTAMATGEALGRAAARAVSEGSSLRDLAGAPTTD